MSTFEVTKEKINVFPHPNADRLELAQVGLYNVVVEKGRYTTGDTVLYIPEYSVLPDNIIAFLGLEGKLAGSKNNRVKPVKLRNEISQGLVAPLTLLPEGTNLEQNNFAEVLGITKYEPVIPPSLSGSVTGSTELINWIDIENLKKFPEIFDNGTEVHITEKIHGTASLFTFVLNGDKEVTEIIVSSKGLGSKQLSIQEDERNVYWRVLREQNLEELAVTIAEQYEGTRKVAIFGETFGSSVQDLHYGYVKGVLGFAAFDAFVSKQNGEGHWVNPVEFNELAENVNVPTVPTLYVGPYSLETVIEFAYGKETISGKGLHMREGVVVRPLQRPEGYYFGGKKIAKYVSDDYLLRKGGTEYN